MDKFGRGVATTLVLFAAMILSGCGTRYLTPSGPADLSKLSNSGSGIKDAFKAKPEASFPANIAVVRIQAPPYESFNARGYGDGAYSVVTVRDFEDDSHIKRLKSMPKVAGVATLNRLLIPAKLEGNEQLREAAAKLQADILLVYTIDTGFFDQQKAAPLALISLGLLPTKNVRVSSTAAALLVDVRTGFIYGAAEDTQRAEQFASVWSTPTAVDETRRKTEKAAFENLLGEIEKLWPALAEKHAD
jgi:hypothetical protein